MKRWVLVLVWFGGQFLWNMITKVDANDVSGLQRALTAASAMTTPTQLLFTIIAMVLIRKRVWERKSLSERMQDKAIRDEAAD